MTCHATRWKTQGTNREQIGVLPIDTPGGPWATVPELLFEKKKLIPALEHILIYYSKA